ncbi:hypothetical protein ONZ45_g16552 [Pleurotus djamor]|nr:hypothetical protein ONZ45_g16552 [Pleurotus djamor]
MFSPGSPALPVEIWLQIFSHLTIIPGALDTFDQDAIVAFTSDTYGILTRSQFKETMASKLAVNLVSRTWSVLATRYLWEHILINSGMQALVISKILVDSPMKARAVVRLEVALEGTHNWESAHAQALADIIQHCPNLACFSTVFSTADAYCLYAPPVLSSLASTIFRVHPIKRLELRADIPVVATLIHALSSTLQVLWMLPPRRITPCSVPSDFELPFLHTCISALDQGAVLQDASIPSLSTCVVDDPTEGELILKRSGEALRRLSIPTSNGSAAALRCCPTLETLTLTTFNAEFFSRNFQLTHPTVATLVLEQPQFFRYICTSQTTERLYVYALRSMLASLICRVKFPSLKCLRLVLPSSAHQYPRQRHVQLENVAPVWMEWLRLCAELHICVEVAMGSQDVFTATWRPLVSDVLNMHLKESFLEKETDAQFCCV